MAADTGRICSITELSTTASFCKGSHRCSPFNSRSNNIPQITVNSQYCERHMGDGQGFQEQLGEASVSSDLCKSWSLPTAQALQLSELWGPFQIKPFYDSMKLFLASLIAFSDFHNTVPHCIPVAKLRAYGLVLHEKLTRPSGQMLETNCSNSS